MSIEFRCTECGKLLRVTDGSVGRQAKCPACGAIVTVTEPAMTAEMVTAGQEPPDTASNHGLGDTANPYQSPVASATHGQQHGSAMGSGIRPTKILFGDVFSHTWNIFTEQWGMGVGVFIAMLVITLCIVGVVAGGVVLLAVAVQDPVVVVPVAVMGICVGAIALLWVSVGMQLLFIKMARGMEVEFSDLFAGGPYLLRNLGGSAFYSLGLFGITSLCIAPFLAIGLIDTALIPFGLIVGEIISIVPAMIFILTFYLFSFLIIDQNLGIMDSFAVSRQVTSGNRLMMLGIILVMQILSSAVTSLTCYLGIFVTAPFSFLLFTVMYLQMIGQPTADMINQGNTPSGER